jgi:hypothetical protein
MLLATALIFPGVGRAAAQEPPPNLRMLLNLDLFTSQPRESKGTPAPGSGDSMVDQIRALNALGYLRSNQNNQDTSSNQNAAVNESSKVDQAEGSGDRQ